jgi:hypothetical protein
MDCQHHAIFNLLLDKLFLAPLQSPKYVVDYGTGTGVYFGSQCRRLKLAHSKKGIWAIEVGGSVKFLD